ncbi:MAG: family 43 glycosylhydrolase [Lachnospiraceae bacterium]|nr:family 43 glycosylhydrolase [Lachnospiraceae bacterium]
MTLKEAIFQNDFNAVEQILVEDPPCIDETDEQGVPYWMHAARLGYFDIVKYVVEYSRASMNTVDPLNRTILHYAAMSGNVELNRYLVEKVGMDIVAGDKNLVTPYQLAWERKHNDLLSYYCERVGAAYEDMYYNPIRTGMFPDPSIVRVGEDYYMVNSSFIFFPCIPISHSRDLIHWEIIGHAITNPEWAHLDELEGGRGYWAPDISYYDGTFYITATYRLNDTGTVYRRQIVVSSDKPEGPYSEPAYIEEDGIDPSIFHDEDGRHYMLLNRGARIFELSSDCKKQISEAKLLYYGSQKRAPEGPHLLKKDGYYYLFLAEGGTGPGHRITVSRSRELMGNYEPCPFNPIMRQTDEKAGIQRCGHGKPVCTQNGQWYMVYLCGRKVERAGESYSILGRETALDPITWTAEGWPMVNGLKGPSVLQIKPDLPEWKPEDKPVSAKWVCPRPPEKDGVFREGSCFRIKGSKAPLESVDARNILLQRQTAFSFVAEADLIIPKLSDGQEAGMTCYYDENTWVSFSLGREGAYFLQVREHVGHADKFHEKYVLADADELIGRSLKFIVETDYLKRKFSYSIDGKGSIAADIPDVYYLCDEGIRMGKRFTGAMVGMYAYAGDVPLTVTFENFVYKNL